MNAISVFTLSPFVLPGYKIKLNNNANDKKGNNKVSKCKLKKYLFGGKN